jgi:hypothetical protein
MSRNTKAYISAANRMKNRNSMILLTHPFMNTTLCCLVLFIVSLTLAVNAADIQNSNLPTVSDQATQSAKTALPLIKTDAPSYVTASKPEPDNTKFVAIVISVFALLISFSIALIAVQQFLLAKGKFNLDLFNKRYAVFKGVQLFVFQIVMNLTAKTEDWIMRERERASQIRCHT